jgi:CRP-like cAMP-binding protein
MLPVSLNRILSDLPKKEFPPGAVLLEEDQRGQRIYFLDSGKVEIERAGVTIATESKSGAMFGEIAALLNIPHTATVRTRLPSIFWVAENGASLLQQHPELSYHLARILATRLQRVSGYLADLKRQYADRDDHLGMVDEIINTLMQRQTIASAEPPK